MQVGGGHEDDNEIEFKNKFFFFKIRSLFSKLIM